MSSDDGDTESEDGWQLNARLVDEVTLLRPKTLGGDPSEDIDPSTGE
jgi:hypothetical protein